MATRVKRNKLERVEERKYVERAEGRGYVVIKLAMSGPYGKAGFDDRITLAEEGVTVLFEFKRDGEEPRKLQNYRHQTLKRLKHHHAVVYYADEAWAILTRLIKEARAERLHKKLAADSIRAQHYASKRNRKATPLSKRVR